MSLSSSFSPMCVSVDSVMFVLIRRRLFPLPSLFIVSRFTAEYSRSNSLMRSSSV